MENLQRRVVPAPIDVVGPFLDRIAEPGGRIWPAPPWPALRLSDGLSPGSRGGHGVIRYEVVDHEPGRRLLFRFAPGMGADGYHEFTVQPAAGNCTELRHLLSGRTRGRMRWAWPLAVRWLHEALLADLFDNWERAATGLVRSPARWSPWVRLLRRAWLPRLAGRRQPTAFSQSRA